MARHDGVVERAGRVVVSEAAECGRNYEMEPIPSTPEIPA